MTLLQPWTDEATDRLRKMVGIGMTAAEIGGALGVTRCAVIGKVSRLGLKLGIVERPTRSGEFEWTAEADAKLREWWLAGLSVAEIAQRFGVRHRASVSARAHRLKLPKRSTTGQSMAAVTLNQAQVSVVQPGRVTAHKPPSPPVVTELAPPPPAGAIAFLDARFGQCRWPLWSDTARLPLEQKFFCGAPCGAKSYCAKHATRSIGISTPSERNAHTVAA